MGLARLSVGCSVALRRDGSLIGCTLEREGRGGAGGRGRGSDKLGLGNAC